MRFDVITLFPELFEPFLNTGINRRAFASQAVQVQLWNPRDFAQGPYRRVDDRPFGGGPGMVMLAEPLWQCLQAIHRARGQAQPAPVLLFSPIGHRLNQARVQQYASSAGAVLLCGRYEGIDQRFVDACVDGQISLGDFVLSGGEIAAMALLDAVARLQPGVLNDQASHEQDSFGCALDGLLDSPHHTRPEIWQGPLGPMAVPEVLLSGHHGQIARYRRAQSLAITAQWRPDLIAQARQRGALSSADEAHLQAVAAAEAAHKDSAV